MADTMKAAFAVGILLFGAALFVPPLADATQENATDTLSVDNQTDTTVTDRLTTAVTDVNTTATPTYVTVDYTNDDTLDSVSTTVDVGNSSTVQLSGDDINTTISSVDGETVRYDVEYPPMFAWNGSARTFFANIEVIIVLLGMAIIVGSVAVVLK